MEPPCTVLIIVSVNTQHHDYSDHDPFPGIWIIRQLSALSFPYSANRIVREIASILSVMRPF